MLCEKIAFPCHWITSFDDFGFKLEGVLYNICMRVLLWFLCFVTAIYDVLHFNFNSMLSMYQNPITSCVNSLHSHAIESLVSMTLDSILKEYCIIFVGGFSFEFYVFGEEIFIPYIYTMFHITVRTIYSTFPMSKSS